MTTFVKRPGVILSDATFENASPDGARYDIDEHLAAGGGQIVEARESLIAQLADVAIDRFGTRLLLEQSATTDSFASRFPDRTYRRRRFRG